MDEHGLHGRARELRLPGLLFGLGAPALAGLPLFGTGLGKAVTEEAAGHELAWLPAVFVLVSALTGGAVLRAALRVFAGAGLPPREHPEGRRHQRRGRGARGPGTLLAAGFAITAVRRDPRRDTAGWYHAVVLPLRRPHSGLVGGYVAWLAVGLAALPVALTARP
ncbi:hypothetical protein [Kitasatospora sp. NPDC085464]|uniref:hypothetical protein n=1 Tax=Kitasatospora sp. NPDC085464 TaxID=3364063 RepID=UPI0037C6318E